MLRIIRSLGIFTLIVAPLLLIGDVTSVVSQPPPGLPSRNQITNSLSQAYGTVLTASGEEILLDIDKAVFLSEFKETIAFVPLHEAYWPRVQTLFAGMLEGQINFIPIGGLVIVEPIQTIRGPDGPGFALKEGTYILWWARSENGLVVTDEEGNQLGVIKGGVTIKFPHPSIGKLSRPLVRGSTEGEFTVVEIETNWMWPVAKELGRDHLKLKDDDRWFFMGVLVGFLLLCL